MIMKPSYETEFYLSDAGYLVIRQDSEFGENEVLLSMEQTEILISNLPSIFQQQIINWQLPVQQIEKSED